MDDGYLHCHSAAAMFAKFRAESSAVLNNKTYIFGCGCRMCNRPCHTLLLFAEMPNCEPPVVMHTFYMYIYSLCLVNVRKSAAYVVVGRGEKGKGNAASHGNGRAVPMFQCEIAFHPTGRIMILIISMTHCVRFCCRRETTWGCVAVRFCYCLRNILQYDIMFLAFAHRFASECIENMFGFTVDCMPLIVKIIYFIINFENMFCFYFCVC